MHRKISFHSSWQSKKFISRISFALMFSSSVYSAPDAIELSFTLSDTVASNSSGEATGAALSALCPGLESLSRTTAQQNLREFCNALPGANSDEQRLAFDQVSSKANAASANISNLQQTGVQPKTIQLSSGGNSRPSTPQQSSYRFQSQIPLHSFLGSNSKSDWDYFYKRINTFASFDSSFSERDETIDETGFESVNLKALIGADYRINNKWILGTAMTLSRSQTDLSGGRGSADATGINWMIFGLHQINSRWSINGTLMLDTADYDNKRNITIGLPSLTSSYSLSAESSANQTGLLLGSDFQWQLPKAFELSLLNQINAARTETDSYNESGNTGFELAINAQSVDNITMDNGVELRKPIMQSWGVIIPQLNFHWIHQFADQSRKVNASFIHDPQANLIAYTTQDGDSDYFSTRLGAVFVMPNGFNAFAQINSILGYQHYNNTTLSIGVRGEF
ncbi:MAG: autotransporter outer membrane beta-barrel domain-containing protein [Pseudomonadales bacterium]|nr:autotransporter outer membrane beta-barrel domain-containing protein [Pseudomonadales bacterium]